MRTSEDRILVLGKLNPRLWIALSESMGKLKVSGKGIWTLNLYRATITEGKSDIFRIKEAVMEKSFYRLTRDYTKFKTASRAFGIIHRHIPYQFPIKGLLQTTIDFLRSIEEAHPEHLNSLYMLWLYKLLELMGEINHLLSCRRCGSEDIRYYVEGYGFLCKKCGREDMKSVSDSLILLFRNLHKFDFQSVRSVKSDTNEIIHLLEDSLKWLFS